MNTKTFEKMFYVLAQILLFLFSPCPALSAGTWKSASANQLQPPNPTELRNWTPEDLVAHGGQLTYLVAPVKS